MMKQDACLWSLHDVRSMNKFRPPEPLVFEENISEQWDHRKQQFELFGGGSGIIGSLSVQRFWATDGNGLSQIFKQIVSTGKKRLNNINLVVRREVKYENSALPVAVRGSKTLHA